MAKLDKWDYRYLDGGVEFCLLQCRHLQNLVFLAGDNRCDFGLLGGS